MRFLISAFLLAVAACMIANAPALAQTRGIGAGALVLDDYNGHTLIFQTPEAGDPGYTSWTAGGPLHLRLPIPPLDGDAMGFVEPGSSVAGPQQVLVWDRPNSGGGTGGFQGRWHASSLSSLSLATASGTPGQLAQFTSTNALGNADLIGDVTTSGSLTTTIANNSTAGAHIVTAINSNVSTGAVDAVNGGTGQASYTTGDILYASSASALSKLPAGTSSQVLGITAGTPAWVTNGATITNNTASASIPVSQNDYTVSPSLAYLRISNTSGGTLDITGISSAGIADGRMITIANVSTSGADIIDITDHNAASSVTDQFDLPGAATIVLGQKGAATFLYDATLQKWELLSTN